MRKAFEKVLGTPSDGAISYCRFLELPLIEAICSQDGPLIGEWAVYGVGPLGSSNPRLISADQAVEKREDKKEPTLLLVDTKTAGAGMDGIYSAGREIKETEFYSLANELARKTLDHGTKTLAKKAVTKARKLITSKHISPLQIFDFFSKCGEMKSVGGALGYIGLWPVKEYTKLEEHELDKSSKMVEKLLLRTRGSSPTTTIIDELLLNDASHEQKTDLIDLIKAAASRPWKEAAMTVIEKEHLWLNNLNPGIFDLGNLKEIEIVPWRSKNDRPTPWSGLIQVKDGELLELVIDKAASSKSKGSGLEIRWKTLPENLAKGACDYNVEIVSGDEVLAEKRITHASKNPQRISFSAEDFEDIEEDAKFEAQARVTAIGDQDIGACTEDFILRFGPPDEKTRSSSANEQRSLIEAIIAIEDSHDFEKFVRDHENRDFYSRDKKGYIIVRHKTRSGKIFCPPLVPVIERDWAQRGGPVGRWKIKIRSDGERVGDPEFLDIVPDCSDNPWTRLCDASAKVCRVMSSGCGMLGMVYSLDKGFDNYVNSWLDVLQNQEISASLALAGTVEVQSLNDETVGLIVLPIHPVRMAWHQCYDMLLKYARYDLKLSPAKIREASKTIDGAHFPAFLPGFEQGRSFVFGDILNFYFVAMVKDEDPEPKANVALMARALSEGRQWIARSVGQATAEALSKEVVRYARLHPKYDSFRIHALRPGDGATLGRALGKSLEALESAGTDEEELQMPQKYGFVLDLFPSESTSSIVGSFFTSITEASRSGFGAPSREDRWMLDNRHSPGRIRRPKLMWAKRTGLVPSSTAHLAIAFDTFDSMVRAYDRQEFPREEGPLEVFGLISARQRSFKFSPQPSWKTFIPQQLEGVKHPISRALTERLVKIHSSTLKLTSKNLSRSVDSWPALYSDISPEKEESLAVLHNLCDWVITVDRNAGIEYFDSPREKSSVYDAYIIECVPEREDLGFLQLVTSTSNFEEISGLLDEAISEMGVSSSPRNCTFLMNQLKSLSGRFAMRLAAGGNVAQEMVAIAYTNAMSLEPSADEQVWPSLRKGFYVPIDDVPQILELHSDSIDRNGSRSDLLYATMGQKGGLQLFFIEIKYRRYLRTARSNEIMAEIRSQLRNSRKKWQELYGDQSSPFIKAINRTKLARILSFYADKAIRHNLDQQAYDKLVKEIQRMIRDGEKYLLDKGQFEEHLDRGYIFCPEYLSRNPSNLSVPGEEPIWLFGPNSVPAVPPLVVDDSSDQHHVTTKKEVSPTTRTDVGESSEIESTSSETSKPRQTGRMSEVILGNLDSTNEAVSWNVDTKSNPHLMIVGLPGMGKTTCLISLCLQMIEAEISPIVFSYHEDFDGLLEKKLQGNLHFVDFDGLGFNPLEVVGDVAHAYVDNVSMIRDIFKAIFPDLGDIQLGALRGALKTSYTDLGWGEFDGRSESPPLPEFQAFYDMLSQEEKRDSGLMTRLSELDDYGFFRKTSGAKSLFDIPQASVIRVHQTQNETLQRAFSTFVLYNLYQRMFQRGPQSQITHAIIFDEAHRAAKLKLIPRMIKECRKFGISFVLASQEAKDFDQSVYSAVANYLVLRVSENDAKVMARVIAASDQVNIIKDMLKRMPKYKAVFMGEGVNRPVRTSLRSI